MMMDYLEYDIMSRYPLLSASEDLTKWTGFISPGMRAILISLTVPQFPTCRGLFLESKELDRKTVKFWNLILEQISVADCNSFLEFLEMLEKKFQEELLKTGMSGVGGLGGESPAVASPDFYSAVIDEVEKIGQEKVRSLSSDFKELVIKHMDMSGREHELKFSIPEKYPHAKPKVTSELPFPSDNLKWPESIQEIHKTFVKLIEKCCKFWDDMDELDARVKVVEPLQPGRNHFHRRILLEDNVIVHLEFNPVAPRALPIISFSGPEALVQTFNAAIDNECNMWDETMRVTQNLRSILDCEFVMKESQDDEDENEPSPCTICFVYSFNDEIPEINCDCGTVYHKQCLQDLCVSDIGKQGLQALQRPRTVECPNCQMDITLPRCLAVTSW